MNNNNDNKIILCLLLCLLTFVLGYISKLYNSEPIVKSIISIDLKKIDNLIQKDTVEIPSHVLDEIKGFRPFVQDIVISIYQYPNDIKSDFYLYKGKGFTFWIANGYDYFRLCEPVTIEFKGNEKKYLWQMTKEFETKLRINQ
jgi:hypothetical protein